MCYGFHAMMALFNNRPNTMTDQRKQIIEALLKTYPVPYLGKDVISSKVLRAIHIENSSVKLELEFGFPIDNIKQQICHDISSLIKAETGLDLIDISISWKVLSHQVQAGLKSVPNVKNIIAIASGKGGVGKSTVCANLALALQAEGAKVGILDADIYGPSQPQILGSYETPEHREKRLKPIIRYNLQSMSIGNLVDIESAMIWRGPMVSTALQQLLNDTDWDNLDYLFIDLPPGTGDIQLTLSQKVPVSAAVVITTPQDLSLIDVRRALGMFAKVKVPVLGIIENMSTHICSHCSHQEAIFGEGGGQKMAEQFNTQLLGQLPLDIQIRKDADAGKPTVVADPNGVITKQYIEIARKLSAQLSLQARNYSNRFPNIVVEEKAKT
ncbi:MAG: mrP protein [Gammaproteobacteria bacterium]|jgi:ATP-binding protein involved in chromosome partitioning|nr:mrP protein [Gammaproteobacteria bacterium]